MPQIDFYVLPDTTEAARRLFSCKLTEKVLRLGYQVHLILEDSDACAQMSHALWSFKPESFLPHIILEGDLTRPALCHITLSSQMNCPQLDALQLGEKPLLLINLSNLPLTPPLHNLLDTAARSAEAVIQNDECLSATRLRYKHYQQQGWPIETRKIESAQ